ncbi:MAG: PD40 domain-containing protein [Verrucomicrobia bacterium]|nr:PD40 domain-containing protein [Verrucomicrobiota bacterium]
MQRITPIGRGALLSLLLAFGLDFQATAQAQTAARIVFEAVVSAKGTTYSQIFSMNPDGSDVTQLTRASANALWPRRSPNQHYIAFFRNGQLWVMDAIGEANGGHSWAVAPANAGGVDWSPNVLVSPDGTTTTYTLVYTAGGSLYTVSASINPSAGTATASAPVLFQSGSWFAPSWSPLDALGGSKIAANGSANRSADMIVVFDAGTPGAAPLATFGAVSDQNFDPSWSPDGSQIAFSGREYVTTTARNGKTTTTIYLAIFVAVPDYSSGNGVAGISQVTAWTTSTQSFPTWSSNGSTLAFSGNGNNAIYAVPSTSFMSSSWTLIHSPGNMPDWYP